MEAPSVVRIGVSPDVSGNYNSVMLFFLHFTWKS
jgi:hypothetical protein